LGGIKPEPNPDSIEVHIGRCDGFNHVRISLWRRHLPIFLGGQDGRVVIAGALGGIHDYVAWDRTWSNPDHKPNHRGGMVLKLRPLVTVAGIDQI
jgi:hypothetical protein